MEGKENVYSQFQDEENKQNIINENQPNQNENNIYTESHDLYQNQDAPPQFFNDVPQQSINKENLTINPTAPNEINNCNIEDNIVTPSQPLFYNKPDQNFNNQNNQISNTNDSNQKRIVFPVPYTNFENNEPVVANQQNIIGNQNPYNNNIPFYNEPYINPSLDKRNNYKNLNKNENKNDTCNQIGTCIGICCCSSCVVVILFIFWFFYSLNQFFKKL